MDAQGVGDEATFESHRRLLLAVAYRILGSASDAEDVVQEAWLRWSRTDRLSVRDARAFLMRVTTRLAIDRLRHLKARRETYMGQWLPEPVVTATDPADDVAAAESVSMALLVVLETLSPLERAVFVLREAFAMPHAEIAELVGRNESAVKQLARRAREHARGGAPRYESDPPTRRRVTERFLAATVEGNLGELMHVLAPGVVMAADSGGNAPAPKQPVSGAKHVARFLAAIVQPQIADRFFRAVGKASSPEYRAHQVQLNGDPGIVVVVGDTAVAAIVLGIDGDKIATLHLVVNPDKLRSLRV